MLLLSESTLSFTHNNIHMEQRRHALDMTEHASLPPDNDFTFFTEWAPLPEGATQSTQRSILR